MSVLPTPIRETPTELPTQSMHSDAGQFPIFDGGDEEVNLPNDDEDTPAFCDSAAASTYPSLPKSSGEIRMDGFTGLVSTNFYP